MKHIKLFENWLDDDDEDKFKDSIYELKPGVVFKTSGDMVIKNVQELIAVQLFFKEKGYSPRNWSDWEDEDYPLCIIWREDKKYALNTVSFLKSSGLFADDLSFGDWFQLKHEFRGHNLKKFGI